MKAKNTWAKCGTLDDGAVSTGAGMGVDMVSDKSSRYPSVLLPAPYVQFTCTRTAVVCTGTVPVADCEISSVALPRCAGVTGPSEAVPSEPPAAFSKVATTPTLSVWVE